MSGPGFCPHVVGSLVRRTYADGSSHVGRVVDREPNMDGWVLWVALADGTVVTWPCDASVQAAAAVGSAMMFGAEGPAVTDLQVALEDRGFSPGDKDGYFGAGTHNALVGLQSSFGLAATGILDSVTATSMGIATSTVNAWPKFEQRVVVAMFSPSTPVGNIKKYLPVVVHEMTALGLTSRRMALMALATIRAESEGFAPISESPSQYNSSPNGHPFDLYDNRADLGNTGKPDGATFRGRGFVQLTGRDNYRTFGSRISQPLEQEPELANRPDIAARLLSTFLKAKEQRIEQALLMDDLRLARRLVNGGQHGLNRFVLAYRTGEALVPA